MEIILTIIISSIILSVFWWAMIEAQTDIPGVNEPNNKGDK